MKRWLTYLLPLVVLTLFWNCKDDTTSTSPDKASIVHAISETVCDNVISASDSELCLPRQISYASPSRIQTTSRRTTSHCRVNIEFAKSGKVINAGLRYFIQSKSILIRSSIIEPAHKLLYLGKLII